MHDSTRAGNSVRNFTFAQVFAPNFAWIHTSPLQYERDNYLAFNQLFKEVGVPNKIIMDETKPQLEGETKWVYEILVCDVVKLDQNTSSENQED